MMKIIYFFYLFSELHKFIVRLEHIFVHIFTENNLMSWQRSVKLYL